MATMIDTNILVDVAVRDPVWHIWSRSKLKSVGLRGPMVINPIIYSEFSVRYASVSEVDTLLPETEFIRESLPWSAAFAASQAFRIYRKSGGTRERVLPDFWIGAHAAIRGYAVLTRDPSGYRTYFPSIDLISPDTHP